MAKVIGDLRLKEGIPATDLSQHTSRSGVIGRRHQLPLCRAAALIMAWALLCVPNPHTEAAAPTEYEVKAAYLYNFGRFVQWPAKATALRGDSFSICVLGEDPFGPILNATIAGETIDGKNVVAKQISAPQQAANCRILFISSSEDRRLKEILAELDKASVLTVGDMPQFARRGGMVQFVLDGNKVRFEVNLPSAERAGLTLSSQLLKLAVSIRKSPQPGD
jgi:uncharacterized protein DUF4154